jgi:hypothetical protein
LLVLNEDLKLQLICHLETFHLFHFVSLFKGKMILESMLIYWLLVKYYNVHP